MSSRILGEEVGCSRVPVEASRLVQESFPFPRRFSVAPLSSVYRLTGEMRCFAILSRNPVTRPHYFWCITLFALCHAQIRAQLVTNALPARLVTTINSNATPSDVGSTPSASALPDDPSLQLLPSARPVPAAQKSDTIRWQAREQTREGDTWTLRGGVVIALQGYVLRADKVTYQQDKDTIFVVGHVQLDGGPQDVSLTADHGEIHPDAHTARFFQVVGSFGVRRLGQSRIYTTPDPFVFTGRVLLQTGENSFRIVDGSMTSCRLPKPDWHFLSRSIEIQDQTATMRNSIFEYFHLPLFYIPVLKHSTQVSGRSSGLLLPIFADSSVKGIVLGDEYYWAINRSTDATVGLEYWSNRGWAPNGDFRYKGHGLDAFNVRWDALFDRGISELLPGNTVPTQVTQGGMDILAWGRRDFTDHTRFGGNAEYLSSYIFRLAFDENLAQATSSEVSSDVALTQDHHGRVLTAGLDRFESFGASGNASGAPVLSVPEVKFLALPNVRWDALDQPIGNTPFYWGLGSSVSDNSRTEPNFHSNNVGRLDIYPYLAMPVHLGQWSFFPEAAIRLTQYSGSQIPDLSGTHFGGVPYVSHDPLTRTDAEFALDVRPPAIGRDFMLPYFHREMRHVIEPQLFYRYVAGIHSEPDTLLFDTTDIAVDTNEAGFALTQRFYFRSTQPSTCTNLLTPCPKQQREWASWWIAQKFFFNPTFGGALITNRRNVFDTTLDLTGVAFLTNARNIAPILSRIRFEVIPNMRIEWDMDYDTKAGRFGANNLYAGYSFSRVTVGAGQALLNAVDESGASASVVQSHEFTPFIYYGKPSDAGFSLGFNTSYDFAESQLQYGGLQAIYNWNCCGLNVGYRRFALGSLRDESELLWGFTLSGIGSAGNIRRTSSIFPTPDVLSHTY